MRFPDWKEFESGSMSSADRAEVERLLSESEAARADYAAYQEYRTTLRQAILAEGIRTERLEAMLGKAAPAGRLPRWSALAAIGLAAIAIAFVVPRMIDGDQTRQAAANIDRISRLQTHDPIQAARWVNQNVDFTVPTYRLTNIANMTGAECGKGWGAYLYNCGKKKARLIIRPKGYQFKDAKIVVVGKTKFYVGRTVGWNCNSCAYEIEGCDEQTRWMLAQTAAKELFGHL